MALNARTKKKTLEYCLFDVIYEDGTRTSNRKVPAVELIGDDKEGAAKAYLEAQDRKIGEASGSLRGVIKTTLPVRR
jgi:hypothetical protein